MHQLSAKTKQILKEYDLTLNIFLIDYLDKDKKWSNTEAIRDQEHDGNLFINRLGTLYHNNNNNNMVIHKLQFQFQYPFLCFRYFDYCQFR